MNITYTGQAPSKGHLHDAGLDLKTAHKTTIWPFQRKAIELSTRACLPTGSYAWLTLRSSLASKRGLVHHLGLIDAGYTGPLKIIVWNLSFRRVRLEEGERIAQLVPATKSPVELTYAEALPTTSRGEGGFGSTGKGTYFGKEKSSADAPPQLEELELAPAAESTEGETDRTGLTVEVFDARLKLVAAKVEAILQTVDGIAARLESIIWQKLAGQLAQTIVDLTANTETGQ